MALSRSEDLEGQSLGMRWLTDSEAGSQAWDNRRSSVITLNRLLKDIGFYLADCSGIVLSSWVSREHRDSQLADMLSRIDIQGFTQAVPHFGPVISSPSAGLIRGLQKQTSGSTSN